MNLNKINELIFKGTMASFMALVPIVFLALTISFLKYVVCVLLYIILVGTIICVALSAFLIAKQINGFLEAFLKQYAEQQKPQ